MYHLSVGTLRHYEKIGLLQPEYIDQLTGYRYYSTRQFESLNTIRYLRVLDMPLEQIADFLKSRDIDRMQELLQKQKNLVMQKQNELKIIERKIDNRLRQLQDAISSQLDVIRMTEIGPRRIAWLRDTLSLQTYLDLEPSIRRLEADQKDTVVFLGKVGVGIAQSQLEAEQYEQYDMVFLLLDQEDEYTGMVEELPAETCVTLRFCGSHGEAPAQYRKLVDFIKKHGLSIAGFSKEITMIDYGMTNDPSQFVTEIQIPVCS